MRSIAGASLKSRLLIVALAAALLVVGIIQLPSMPVDVLPEFTPPYVEVQTEALGLSAEEVEQLITLGMEQDLLNGVPWVQTIRSESLPGLSSIVIVFKPGTDLMRARQMVAERLTQAYALPHVSKPPIMIQPLSATSRVMIVGLSSKSLSPIQVSLLGVLETTGNALWWSTLSFVEASTPGSGGFIDTHNQRLGIRHISPIVSP